MGQVRIIARALAAALPLAAPAPLPAEPAGYAALHPNGRSRAPPMKPNDLGAVWFMGAID